MATFEEKNPYVSVVLPASKKKPYVMGLLSQPKQDTGLLGESTRPANQADYNVGLLTQDAQQNTYDLNALRQQYYQNYMNAMNEQQQKKDEAAMEKSAGKAAKKYGSAAAQSSQYSDIGQAQGSTLPAGTNEYGATSNAIQSNDGGITTTTYDSAGNQIGNTTTSQGTPDAGSSGSSASYVGAATGALAGYGRGKKNYYTDPAMRDGKDGFGKYHRDYRAEVGGGTVGGLIGYYTEGLGNGFIGPIVDWLHPYAQDATRWLINTGDSLGGAYGAMVADPIGSWASGKYSNSDLFASGLTPMLAPIAGGKAPDIAQKASNPISDVGNKIADVFGW